MSNDSTLPTPGAMPLTMSSREIAELTGKEHKNVIRDIRGMLGSLYGPDRLDQVAPETRRQRHREFCGENAKAIIGGLLGDGSEVSHAQASQSFQGVSWERDARGYITLFRLDKEHTITLVTGYDVVLRKKIVDRWMELEAGTSTANVSFMVPRSLSEALRLAADQAEKIERQNAQITAMAPKVEFHDNVAEAINCQTVEEVAKILGTGQNRLFAWLRAESILMKSNRPYQRFVDEGYFRVVERAYKDNRGEAHTYTRTLVTGKGLAYIQRRFVDAA